MKPFRIAPLVGFVAVTFAAAALGSAATFQSVGTWYQTLQKPAWNPPSSVFSPVWTILYIAMSIAAWRAWRKTAPGAGGTVIRLYGAQLILNALWSILFFGMRRPDLALIDIVALWILLIIGLVRFWRLDRIAGLLWAPYVAWVSFAAFLNFTIWQLNR